MEQVAVVDALVLQHKSTKISSKVDNVPPGVSEIKHLFALQNEATCFWTSSDSVTEKTLQTQVEKQGLCYQHSLCIYMQLAEKSRNAC